MFYLTSYQTTTILPNPQFSDSEEANRTVTSKRAMNGTLYTYIKTAETRKLQWTFRLTRNKALELREFLSSYFASPIKIIDHNARVWNGHFTDNPFEFDTPERAEPALYPLPRGEAQTITLNFEGKET